MRIYILLRVNFSNRERIQLTYKHLQKPLKYADILGLRIFIYKQANYKQLFVRIIQNRLAI